MVLGTSLAVFTVIHVALSLIGITSGFIVIFGMTRTKRMPALTALFLATTLLTSLTGFLFPFKGFTPGIVIGIVSVIVLLVAILALYGGHVDGAWRGTFVITAVLAQYFNFFVLIVQSFQKVPALNDLALTQTEMPFKAAQLFALIAFIVLGALAFKWFPGERRKRSHSSLQSRSTTSN